MTDNIFLRLAAASEPLVVYIAGPMRGYPRFNFQTFDDARDLLRSMGAIAISPADLDREIGFDPDKDTLESFNMEAAFDRDVTAIKRSDAVVMLPGHEKSTGATAERQIGKWLGKEVYELPDGDTYNEHADVLMEAYKHTTGDRQASYGSPDQDFRRTADMINALFSDMLMDGVKFQPFHVAQIMILVKMSRQLHQRKRDNWVDTAGYARCGAICDEVEEGQSA